MKKGYEKTYDWVIKLLQTCDFAESAKRLNLNMSAENEIIIYFLGKKYIVSKNGVELVEEKIAWSYKTESYDYNLKSVLAYYVLSEANVEPQNDFCMLSHFSGGIFNEGRNEDWSKNSLAKVYGNDYNKFRNTAERLGMLFEGEKSICQYVWKYLLLPKIPIKIIYYEGDDEYPSKLQILYDKTAIQFYKFEPLAVLNMCFAEGLAAAGESPPPPLPCQCNR
ncbi:MAG: DUF3786 domain-containing protein [Spirochaetaceae bacterium]|jgi:hypothetical protein|nr:DUF3786 domain-containing protein [Spirochaetaceae bacterium]